MNFDVFYFHFHSVHCIFFDFPWDWLFDPWILKCSLVSRCLDIFLLSFYELISSLIPCCMILIFMTWLRIFYGPRYGLSVTNTWKEWVFCYYWVKCSLCVSLFIHWGCLHLYFLSICSVGDWKRGVDVSNQLWICPFKSVVFAGPTFAFLLFSKYIF